MTCPPDVALNARLPASTPNAVRTLLFADLASFNVDSDETDVRLRDVAALIDAGRVLEPRTWRLDKSSSRVRLDDARHKVYVALMLRINILEAYCEGLRLRQAKKSAATSTVRTSARQQFTRKIARDMAQRTVETPLDEVDVLAHYMHVWLDAHLLAATAFDAMGMVPRDAHRWTTVVLDAYSPSAATVMHEGELPNLVARIESCSFFAETSTSSAGSTKRRDPVAHMLSKSIPLRCVVRDVISIIESACLQDDAVIDMFSALIGASLLGVYRHSRARPSLTERLRIYQALFFNPPAPLATAIDEARASRGVSTSLTSTHSHDFVLPPANERSVQAGDYVKRRREVGLPASARDSNVTTIAWTRRRRVYGYLASLSFKNTTKAYTYQRTIVNVLREYLVFAVERFIPHLYEELVERTGWLEWQATVVNCMDGMRARDAGVSIFQQVYDWLLPPKTLHRLVRSVSFVQALATACTSYLDSGQGASTSSSAVDRSAATGSERPLDAAYTHEVDLCLRFLVSCYTSGKPRNVPLLPVTQVPQTWQEFERDFVPRGRFPLMPFHSTAAVVREYKAAAANYAKSPSPAYASALVVFLAEDASLYQLLLVRAFAQAQIDEHRIIAFPLSRHLADKQAAVLRERLRITDPTEPLPRHLLTTFVCRNCREFRGSLIPETAEASNEMPMFGSERVAMTTTSLEQRSIARLERDGFPTWRALVDEVARVGATTLFDYYAATSSIDGDMAVYPRDPVDFNAPDGTIDYCERWCDEREAERREHQFTLDNIEPLSLAWKARRIEPSTEIGAGEFVVPPFDRSGVYETFLERWSAMNGRPFIVGHRSLDPNDETIVWTCSSDRYKAAERKTHQTSAAMQYDAVRRFGRARATNPFVQKSRRFDYTAATHGRAALGQSEAASRHACLQCLLAVLAVARHCRVDAGLRVARRPSFDCRVLLVSRLHASVGCTLVRLAAGAICHTHSPARTGTTTCCRVRNLPYSLARSHRYDDSLLCARCWRRTQEGSLSSLGAFGLSTSIKCMQCRQVRKSGERFHTTTVYDDVVNRFVSVYFCDAHARKKSWLFGSPNYQALSAVTVGVRAGWGAMRSWDASRDYGRNVVAFARIGMNEADEHELAAEEADEEARALETARSLLGATAIDDDGAEEALDDSAASDDGETGVSAAKKTKRRKIDPKSAGPKRRLVAAERGRRR